MGRKTKIKGSGVWRFILLPHTIKEVCSTPMLYLTKTEGGREEENRFGVVRRNPFFFSPLSLFFLKWRLEKNKKSPSGGVAEAHRGKFADREAGSENSRPRKQKNKGQGEGEKKKKKRV